MKRPSKDETPNVKHRYYICVCEKTDKLILDQHEDDDSDGYDDYETFKWVGDNVDSVSIKQLDRLMKTITIDYKSAKLCIDDEDRSNPCLYIEVKSEMSKEEYQRKYDAWYLKKYGSLD